jgi:hypothetical protein
LVSIFPNKPSADTMERASPAQGLVHDAGPLAENLSRDPLDTFRHLRRGTPRERHEQDSARVGAANDQVGDPVGEGIRLTGSSAGDDQQGRSDMAIGSDAMLDGPTLLRIERLKIGCGRRRKHELSPVRFQTR